MSSQSAQTENRAKFSDEVRVYGHWIGGRETPSSPAVALESRNPATGMLAARVAAGTAEDVDAAVASSAAASKNWAALPPANRSRHLHRIAAAVRAQAAEIATLEVAETGKPFPLAMVEAEGVAEYLEYYAGVVRAEHGQVIERGNGQHIYTRREPFGVVGIITPWNAPVYSAIRAVAPALAVGNAVIVKPSEYTSTTTLRFAQIASEAGLPDGVLNVLTGAGVVGTAVVSHPGVGKVSFTGSVTTGRIVARLAADRLIPVVLELGGKSPHIIFADAKLDEAVEAAIAGFTMNTGQVCAAGTRLLVERAVHDDVVQQLVAALEKKNLQESLGPIITEPQYRKVNDYIDIGLSEGATVASGGKLEDATGAGNFFVQPTIFTGVHNQMRIAREEIFGPVLSVIAFDSEDDAVDIANDTNFGLVAGVWTADMDRAFRLADRIESGQVFVNTFGSLDVETPFGGYKDSGYGREKGIEALKEFTRVKSVWIGLRANPSEAAER